MTTEAEKVLWLNPERTMEWATDLVRNIPRLCQTQKNILRVHGNGFIQIDLEPGLRFHIWDESIPRQVTPTPIHDHRFGFVSRILMGELINISCEAIPTVASVLDKTDKPTLLHRLYTPVYGTTEDTKLVPFDEVLYVFPQFTTDFYLPGEEYRFEAREFHITEHRGLTATLMRKTSEIPDHRVRIGCPADLEPDNVFNRYEVDLDAMWRIVERVSRALSG